MSAASDRDSKFHAEYVPPPPPAPGKIFVKCPLDDRGRPVCSDLHLTPDQAEELINELNGALQQYLEHVEIRDA